MGKETLRCVVLVFVTIAATQIVTGPDFLMTDGTRQLTLTCHADTSQGELIVWFTPGTEVKRCAETGPTDNVCTFIPRLEDDNQNVTCIVINDQGISTGAVYRVNLTHPPPSSPTINTESRQPEPLKHGDYITCTVSGGKPRVTNITFHCQHPDLADGEDDVSDDGRNVSSSVRVHLSNTTGVYMNCTCSATWQPEPELYSDKTAMIFLLETSPRIMDGSYDPLNPPILEATGHTFFLVAYPVPDTTKSFFFGSNTAKELVPENTFKTEFTRNATRTHLLNCRVTPQNVPAEKLGLYELSMSNRLGYVSLDFNVTSPATTTTTTTMTSTAVHVVDDDSTKPGDTESTSSNALAIGLGVASGVCVIAAAGFGFFRKRRSGGQRNAPPENVLPVNSLPANAPPPNAQHVSDGAGPSTNKTVPSSPYADPDDSSVDLESSEGTEDSEASEMPEV